jgi:hypothetical protein
MSTSRVPLIAAGITSLVVFIYAFFMHAILIIETLTRSRLLSRLMTPEMGVLHGTICVVGGLLGLGYVYHIVWRNQLLSRRGRLLWSIAVAVGYGQAFYWYNHLAGSRAIDKASLQSGKAERNCRSADS